ncbi:MAG: 2,3-bisphosphoglycerate-independent phosphoglycerate mutase [Firmicutes bacterium]|nr:2,3-bisphosphoglycerate-independent phosphoglycerate mutase [Bacillota bacterium]
MNTKLHYKGPVVLVILDGFGLSDNLVGNAVKPAHKPNLDQLMSRYPMLKIRASGTAVGLTADQAGNSEVGHYIMGVGQIVKQALPIVDEAFATGKIFAGKTWRDAIRNVLEHQAKLHFIGCFSDGRVHADINHLFKMIARADREGVQTIRIHAILDGRDVSPRTEPKYINLTEAFLQSFNERGRDYHIASGGGRQFTTMDRYWSDPKMLKRALSAHVYGMARPFHSALEALETFRREELELDDQWTPIFIIAGDDKQPIGKMAEHDTVINYNFRADRAIQFSELMTLPNDQFPYFDRGKLPKVYYAGMVEYDQTLHLPGNTLVEHVEVKGTLAELEVRNGRKRYVISETVKFGHVTFYFNGNKDDKFNERLEEYVEVPNKTGEPWQFPWMRSDDITDKVIEQIKAGDFQSILINYPNGDMVGHESHMDASIIAVEALDLALGRLMTAIDEAGGVLVVTADHGNIEEEYYLDEKGQPIIKDGQILRKTSHTTNPVPFIIYDNTDNRDKYVMKTGDHFGLSNIAATMALLDGLEPLAKWDEPLIELK